MSPKIYIPTPPNSVSNPHRNAFRGNFMETVYFFFSINLPIWDRNFCAEDNIISAASFDH